MRTVGGQEKNLVLGLTPWMAVFRVWRDLIRVELLPFGITALMAGMGWNPSARRQALCVGAVGTLVLPFLAAAWSNP